MKSKSVAALLAFAAAHRRRAGRRAGGLQDRHLGRSDRLCGDVGSRLARRRRGRRRLPQRQGRHPRQEARDHHRGQRSEPQEAVTVYRKMIIVRQRQHLRSGCVSAGNFAAAPLVVRAQIPMVLCSILPQQPDHVKWAFSTLAAGQLRGREALEYLKDKTQIRKIGVLHDPTPYAMLQKDCGREERRPTSASRSSASSNTSRTTPTSASRSAR